MKAIVLCVTIVIGLCRARPNDLGRDDVKSCGYDSCHPIKEGVLNVHIVPHTHDDVGWLKTVDQYYYGSNTVVQKAGVQYIIDSVIDELMKDPSRRFVYVESFFFEHWWREQTDTRRHHVKRLVNEGRLEFAGGAWSMNDEAAAHYHSVLDQLTWGLRMLNDTFGTCGRPKAGWQIDPFGHSRELAGMWASAGFDGLLLGRIDYQDKRRRIKDQELEMLWRGNDDLGETSDIITGIMYNTYQPPPGFCFDILCSDEPFIDDKKSPDYNVDRRVKNFMNFINEQRNAYKTNNVIVTMGGDFTYQDALMWYKNLDKLIKYVNERETGVNLIYSTPSCYIKSLYDANTTWPTKQDDFFPYSSDEHAYWTGYFTSRPTQKYYERRGNNHLQICKQLYSMTNLDKRNKVDLNMLRSAMGILQHHDAITGTEKQHVANDYARILGEGIQDCFEITQEALNKLMMKQFVERNQGETYYLPMQMCQLNITECPLTENESKFILTVYNPFGHTINEFVRIPVTGSEYTVTDPKGNAVDNEIVPISEYLLKQLTDRKSKATGELIILATNLPPLGYRSYYVESKSNIQPNAVNAEQQTNDFIENEFIKVQIDGESGIVSEIIVKDNNQVIHYPFKQELLYYEGMIGNNSNSINRASGAYIFRPTTLNPMKLSNIVEFTVNKSKMVEEIHQRYTDWASQIIRLYPGQKHVEFEWLVGPIPVEDKIGKEIVSRFSSNITTNGAFYTDSNGRQMLKRIINKRPTWKLEQFELTSGNYYPCTSMISVKDEVKDGAAMYVLTDRAQGCSSLRDGQVELMIHRRLLHDDAFGVEEALNETVNGLGLVAKGTHYLILGNSDIHPKILALKKLLQPAIIVSDAQNLTKQQWMQNQNEFIGLNELPPHVHILTLEPWKERSILLRLENFMEKSYFKDKPKTVIDLSKLFIGMEITSVRETTLAANQWKTDADRLKFNPSIKITNTFNDWYGKNNILRDNVDSSESEKTENDSTIELAPMEIRTFIINVNFKY